MKGIINYYYSHYSINYPHHIFTHLMKTLSASCCLDIHFPPFLPILPTHSNKSPTSQQKPFNNRLCIYDAGSMVACLELLISR